MVETRDDTLHTIEHVGEVPLSHVGQKGRLMNVLHVPTITKNLVSVGHFFDQGMQVRFTHLGPCQLPATSINVDKEYRFRVAEI